MKACVKHGGWISDHEAVLIGSRETGSGTVQLSYACHGCVREHGLVPLTASGSAWIGRRDTAPILPPGPLVIERTCTRCGRLVTMYTVRANDDDHGPLEIVWCADTEACNEARAARRQGMWLPPHVG